MKKLCLLAVNALLLIHLSCQAQNDTIWLMNGKKVVVNTYQLNTEEGDSLTQNISFTNPKGRNKKIYTNDIFSIKKSNQSETIFYTPQPEIGEKLSVPQMRSYVTGLQRAQNEKPNKYIVAGSIAAGLIGAFTPQTTINVGKSSGTIPLGILIPVGYVSLTGYFTPSQKYLNANSLPLSDEYYVMGFEEGFKMKTIRRNILAACAGYLVGVVVVNSISNSK